MGVSNEPARVEMLRRLLPTDYPPVTDANFSFKLVTGPGDDCAVYSFDGNGELVFGSDYVRGPKFQLYEQGLLNEYDIGYYLVAANVSDIAAMGARPLGITTVVRYPSDLSDESFLSLMQGISDASAKFGCPNVGGDIGSAERIILSGSAIGVVSAGRSLRRTGARPGDVVATTGPTGMAAAALIYFSNTARSGLNEDSVKASLETRLISYWKKPVAQVAAGALLSQPSGATSCQDTSDGLKATVEQLAAASAVGIHLERDWIPIHPDVAAVAAAVEVDPLTLSLSGSVDFQLCFTVPAVDFDSLQTRFATSGLEICKIGTVIEGPEVALISDGEESPLPGLVWDHTEAAKVQNLTTPKTAGDQ